MTPRLIHFTRSGWMTESGREQVKRHEQPLAQHLLVGDDVRPLDDRAEQTIAGVAVFKLPPRTLRSTSKELLRKGNALFPGTNIRDAFASIHIRPLPKTCL